ncbi:conserved hypothetical protein [Thermincola potens JR]|uniref:Uncharacterized protein n=2 Tax=Thermincola TaxID=278993 RepID=D5XCZ7_THEPJ|nr:conserved hypothetical protein [Thermincola potens JR]
MMGDQKQMAVFKRVFLCYLLHYLVIIPAALITYFWLPDFPGPTATMEVTSSWFLNLWTRYDSGWYYDIIKSGYTAKSVAFFPLYPFTVKLFSRLLDVHPVAVGLIISNLAFFGLLWFLYKLVQREFGTGAAQKATLYYALFPTGIFFSAMYTESMFMFFVLGAFYFAGERKWTAAGLMGGLAALTRNLGVYLFISLGYLYLKQADFRLRNFKLNSFALGLIPLGLAVYMLYLHVHFNDAFAFVHAQKYWNRELVFPLAALVNSGIKESGPSIVFLSLLLVAVFRLPPHYWIYYAFMLLIPMSMGVKWEGEIRLFAMLRYILPCFPAMIILAKWGRFKSLNYSILTLFICGLVFFTALFVKGFFIA